MAYVGQEQFFAGARDYFARHAYGNTELADLLDCLERSSGRDLRAWSRAWLETAGISRLDPVVETGPDGRITRLAVTQDAVDAMTGAAVDRPHRVVIGLYEPSGDGLRAGPVDRDRRRRARGPRCPRPSAARPRWCWSTTTTSPTPRCASTPARWPPSARTWPRSRRR